MHTDIQLTREVVGVEGDKQELGIVEIRFAVESHVQQVERAARVIEYSQLLGLGSLMGHNDTVGIGVKCDKVYDRDIQFGHQDEAQALLLTSGNLSYSFWSIIKSV